MNLNDDDEQEEDDLLALCTMVEEYKECFEIAESENRELKAQLHLSQQEVQRLKDIEVHQTGVIRRLDDSVNLLVEEVEQSNQILDAKEADLSSLQHVLGVIHKRKVEVDDQTQIEQSRVIEALLAEKLRLSEAYSSNLRILEDYVVSINQRDSEILDLKHTIKNLEYEIETMSTERYDGTLSDNDHHEDVTERPAAAVSPVKKSAVKKVKAEPTVAPPSPYIRGMRPSSAPSQPSPILHYTSNPSLSITTSSSADKVRRTGGNHASGTTKFTDPIRYLQSEDPEQSSDDNVEEENSPAVVTISRNRSTRMPRSYAPLTGTSTGSHSLSTNSLANATQADAAAKELALSKFRRYAALNTDANTTNNTTTTTTNTNDEVDYESNDIDGTGTLGTSTHSVPKWSDVGKHERLFHKVDILKTDDNPPPRKSKAQPTGATTTTTSSIPTTKAQKHAHSVKHTDIVDFDVDDVVEHYSTHSTHGAKHNQHNKDNNNDDSVEVFVQIDSNPPSPERMKPNKLFKPPFSKPVFNEFTHNTLKSSGHVNASSNSASWAKRDSYYDEDRSESKNGSISYKGAETGVKHTDGNSAPGKSSFLFRRGSGIGGGGATDYVDSGASGTRYTDTGHSGASNSTDTGTGTGAGNKKTLRAGMNGQESSNYSRL